MHAENERLTEERNTLQNTIRQLEQKISTLEAQINAAQAAEAVSSYDQFYLSSTT